MGKVKTADLDKDSAATPCEIFLSFLDWCKDKKLISDYPPVQSPRYTIGLSSSGEIANWPEMCLEALNIVYSMIYVTAALACF